MPGIIVVVEVTDPTVHSRAAHWANTSFIISYQLSAICYQYSVFVIVIVVIIIILHACSFRGYCLGWWCTDTQKKAGRKLRNFVESSRHESSFSSHVLRLFQWIVQYCILQYRIVFLVLVVVFVVVDHSLVAREFA